MNQVVFDGALWAAIPIAVAAGLISFLSPCVLPLVPGYLGFIGGAVAPRQKIAVGAGGGDAAGSTDAAMTAAAGSTDVAHPASGTAPATTRTRLLGGVLLFIAGFTLVFVFVIVLGGTFGRFFLQYGDLITRILGVVIIALGLVFIGAFGFMQRTLRPRFTQRAGLIGAPLLGIALGIGWTPCIGPTLTAILSVSWTLGDPARAIALGLAYSAGLGIPFILLALGFGWASRSVAFLRRHIRVVNIIGGALLVVLGVLMVTGLWTDVMSRLGAVMISVELPL